METNLPESLEAERIILSNLLCDDSGETLHACSRIKPHHFSSRSHKIVFEAIQSLSFEGKTTDLVTVSNLLASSNKITEVGGHGFVSGLFSSYLTSAHSQDHIDLIVEKYKLRRILEICEEAKYSTLKQEKSAEECIKNLEQEILLLDLEAENHENQLKEAYEEVKAMIEIRKGGQSVTGLLSKVKPFDDVFFGFQLSQLYVLAGRPSSGKTAFADQITGNLLMDNKCVVYISLESDRARVLLKLACKICGVSFWDFKRNKISPEHLLKVERINEILKTKELILLRPFDISPTDIRPLIRRLQRKQKIDLVVLDYIQKINIPNGWDERRTVSRAISEVQRACLETEIPALVLAQLNRESEGGRPSLRHLKESGQIEQDADNVALLWSNVDKRELDQAAIDHPCILSVEKNKDGASGLDVEMNFEMKIMKFKEKPRI